MTAAQIAFKTAFSAARGLRAEAVGEAEYSGEHRCLFVTYRFEEKVRCAIGYPNIDATSFRAALAAALVVAAQDYDSRNPKPSLADRLAAHSGNDVYHYN